MLCLTRRTGEKIQIGKDVFVTVIKIKGSQVKLGIDAPDDVQIRRDDVVSVPPIFTPMAGEVSQ